jgi:hypothetical protein
MELIQVRSNRKALLRLTLTSCLLSLTTQTICPSCSLAESNGPSLGGSNLTNGLNQSSFERGVFRYRSPLGDALSPTGRASEPFQLGSADPGAQTNNAQEISNKTSAWYKFLDPSLNLARTLGQAERHRLLSIVPMPLDIRGRDKVKSDNRVVLLRADNTADYACFKTIWGSLFGRSGSLILVSSSGLVVRMLNLNGREKDVLFKLPNGQVVTVGPGSEMVVSKELSLYDIGAADGIARRGLSRIMKCSDLQLAFSQFSHASVFELPELKFFTKNQKAADLAPLASTVSRLNEIRGTAGFTQASAAPTQTAQKSRDTISAARNAVVKLIPVAKPAAGSDAKAAPKVAVQTNLEKDRQKQIADAAARKQAALEKEAAAKKEAERLKQIALKKEQTARKESERLALAKEAAAREAAELQKETAAKKEMAARKEAERARQIAMKKEAAAKKEAERLKELALAKEAAAREAAELQKETAAKKEMAAKKEAERARQIAMKKEAAAKKEAERLKELALAKEAATREAAELQKEEAASKELAAKKEAERTRQIAMKKEAAAKKEAERKQAAERKQELAQAKERELALQKETELRQEAERARQVAQAKQAAIEKKIVLAKDAAEKKALKEQALALSRESALKVKEEEAARKREIALKQEAARKQEIALKQEAARKQEIALKQEAARKQEIALKQEAARKQEIALKQKTERKQEIALKQKTERKQEVALKPEATTRLDSSLRPEIALKKETAAPAAQRKVTVAAAAKLADARVAAASKTARAFAGKLKAKEESLSALGGKLKDRISKAVEVKPARPAAAVSTPINRVSTAPPRYLLPREMPGPDTPADLAKLILDANREEKLASSLRKKADKCMEFINGGLMNYEQQRRMELQARQALKQAGEAEERSQALRKQVELAGSNRQSIQ